MTEPVETVEITDGAWTLLVAPERGASLARVAWRHPDGDWREICRRPSVNDIQDRSGSLSRLSSFVMLPFVNRLDGARFVYDGVERCTALNRPEQGCAIHGLSRESAWRVRDRSETRIVCKDDFAREGAPWRYLATQTVSLEPEGPRIELAVRNQGDRPMPFGFGLHPWFPRTPESRLRFRAAHTLAPDDRTFPMAVETPDAQTSFADPVRLEDRIGLDRAYPGWSGTAEILQADLGYRVEVAGEGALGKGALGAVHIFVAPDRPDFCVEPVSHVTDVLNRPEFAPYGDMARLEPGETLTGAMRLSAQAL
ncbi:MAG: hypothetical protein AAFW46_12855 [Pseudomonadota bacterium]